MDDVAIEHEDESDDELVHTVWDNDDGTYTCQVEAFEEAIASGGNPYEAIARAFRIAADIVNAAERAADEAN